MVSLSKCEIGSPRTTGQIVDLAGGQQPCERWRASGDVRTGSRGAKGSRGGQHAALRNAKAPTVGSGRYYSGVVERGHVGLSPVRPPGREESVRNIARLAGPCRTSSLEIVARRGTSPARVQASYRVLYIVAASDGWRCRCQWWVSMWVSVSVSVSVGR